jgi:hypothetical protein
MSTFKHYDGSCRLEFRYRNWLMPAPIKRMSSSNGPHGLNGLRWWKWPRTMRPHTLLGTLRGSRTPNSNVLLYMFAGRMPR